MEKPALKSASEDGVQIGSNPVDSNADAALALFEEAELEGEVRDFVDEKMLRWKIDLRVMPLL